MEFCPNSVICKGVLLSVIFADRYFIALVRCYTCTEMRVCTFIMHFTHVLMRNLYVSIALFVSPIKIVVIVVDIICCVGKSITTVGRIILMFIQLVAKYCKVWKI